MQFRIPDFSKARVLVMGDVMLDRYWTGKVARISPEAPVPVVHVKTIEDRLGGAANVALNIARLGGKVSLIGVIGDDDEGRALTALLESEGVNCEFVVQPSLKTICKLRVMAQNQQLIRVDFEESPLQFDQQALFTLLLKHLPQNNTLVFSDYGKGTLAKISDYIATAKQAGITLLADPKGNDYQRYQGVDVITPNLAEFQAVVGVFQNEQELIEKGLALLQNHHISALLLTRGEAGMTLITPDNIHSLSAQAKDVFDVTGAGDSVIAVLAATVSLGTPLFEAMYLANLAGGIVVGKLGTSTVAPLELARAMHSDKGSQFGIVTEDELATVLQQAKAHGERIIMTNGCFDLLHTGHVSYLQQAKALGDRLVIAVNSDASVKRLKGESRPINSLHERMTVLSALACVDWVVAFEEDTPERLYCKLLPDVIVKGGDYSEAQVAGGDCVIKAGGKVKILPFVDGLSTTAMINKAKITK